MIIWTVSVTACMCQVWVNIFSHCLPECPLTGAAYASSSSSALPSSTFPQTIASFGFINQPAAGDTSFPVSDGLMAGRGCPVGDAAADRSPVLLPSPPERLNEPQDPMTAMSTPYPLHLQASSTPMVRQVNVVFTLDLSLIG